MAVRRIACLLNSANFALWIGYHNTPPPLGLNNVVFIVTTKNSIAWAEQLLRVYPGAQVVVLPVTADEALPYLTHVISIHRPSIIVEANQRECLAVS
jgi:hypothetical protein